MASDDCEHIANLLFFWVAINSLLDSLRDYSIYKASPALNSIVFCLLIIFQKTLAKIANPNSNTIYTLIIISPLTLVNDAIDYIDIYAWLLEISHCTNANYSWQPFHGQGPCAQAQIAFIMVKIQYQCFSKIIDY